MKISNDVKQCFQCKPRTRLNSQPSLKYFGRQNKFWQTIYLVDAVILHQNIWFCSINLLGKHLREKWICTSPMQLYYLNKNVKSVTWRNLQIKILRLFLTRYSEINENKWLKIGYLNSFKIMCFPCCLLQI